MKSLTGADVLRHIADFYDEEDVSMLMNQLLTDDVGVSGENVDVAGWQMVDGMVTFSGAWLPHWTLHPVHASVQILIQIEEWHILGYVPSGLQALWMNAVIPKYIQDYSVHSQLFVRNAIAEIEAVKEEVDKNIVSPACPNVLNDLYRALVEHPPSIITLISEMEGSCHTKLVEGSLQQRLHDYETHLIVFYNVNMDVLV